MCSPLGSTHWVNTLDIPWFGAGDENNWYSRAGGDCFDQSMAVAIGKHDHDLRGIVHRSEVSSGRDRIEIDTYRACDQDPLAFRCLTERCGNGNIFNTFPSCQRLNDIERFHRHQARVIE